MSGIALSTLATMIGNIFTVYLFGATALGDILSFIFLLGIFVYMAFRFGVSGEGMLLVLGLVGVFGAVFMPIEIGLRAILGFVFGLVLFAAMARLLLRRV